MDDAAPGLIHLLGQTVGSPDADFSVAEWEDHAESDERRPIAPLHRHLEDDEVWYVLEGSLGFSLDGVSSTAPVGTLIWVRPGVVHTYWNARGGTARYLLIAPVRVFDLIESLHTTGGDREKIRDRFDAHRSELIEATGLDDR